MQCLTVAKPVPTATTRPSTSPAMLPAHGVKDEELIHRLISMEVSATLQDMVSCCCSYEATCSTASAIQFSPSQLCALTSHRKNKRHKQTTTPGQHGKPPATRSGPPAGPPCLSLVPTDIAKVSVLLQTVPVVTAIAGATRQKLPIALRRMLCATTVAAQAITTSTAVPMCQETPGTLDLQPPPNGHNQGPISPPSSS
ncbi:hypothetical protein E2C01_045427 [Portunus trituberculatus]|uniref:Uncharacterized protein n=1 Tax=Portunus trituberculatus TaxID=210409 RepID=A0A5B7G363_PORTR|nr:hypothetical protein [Portunus trituberculatus]